MYMFGSTALEWWLSKTVSTSGAEKGIIMDFLVVAAIAITGVGFVWYMRARTAH
jgi:hypothetical protein